MTPALARLHAQIDAWAEKAHREIHAMAVVHHRGIGQRARFALARVRAIQTRKETPCRTI